MNKVILLGDLHYGARKASKIISNHQRQFFEWFWKDIERHNTKDLIQLGDVTDNHGLVHSDSVVLMKETFLDKSQELGYDVKMLVGNHDISNKHSLDVNALTTIVKEFKYKNIEVIDKPIATTIGAAEAVVCLFPWICRDNEEDTKRLLEVPTKTKRKTYAFGHFEFKNFTFSEGITNETGIDPAEYKQFTHVLSGHYHCRSQLGNVTYIGTPYQLSWTDCGDVKGYHVLDLDTNELEFCPSPFSLYKKVYLDLVDGVAVLSGDSNIKDTYVKLYISDSKITNEDRDKATKAILEEGIHDLEIVECFVHTYEGDIELDLDTVEFEDSRQILDRYVTSFESDEVNKEDLKNMLYRLYNKALNEEL